MRLTAQIDAYEMDQVILDLGSGAKVLPMHTWKHMGEPKFEWSNIQLRMANQQNIIPLGRLSQTVVDIEGVKVLVDFEVIHIVDDTDPYPALLDLDWAIYMNGIINIKRRSMVFENNETKIVVPPDPAKGVRYIEPVHVDDDVDHIYKLT